MRKEEEGIRRIIGREEVEAVLRKTQEWMESKKEQGEGKRGSVKTRRGGGRK